jgi:DNA-binding transcriptional LysR family regulator
MGMNIPDLEAFVAVVETGSIVGASARLNITQSAVTRRIQNLEDRLGSELLNRHSKPLKPTATGREAYEHGRRVLRSIEDLKAGISAGSNLRGEFRLGVMHYLSEAALTAPLDRLRSDFPELQVHVTTGWSPRLLEQVMRSELDAAAIVLEDGAGLPDDLRAEELGPQRFVLVAAQSLEVPQPARTEDLSRLPWVMNEVGCGCRESIRRRFESARLPFQISVEAASMELRLSLVTRGLGLALVTPDALAKSAWRDSVEIVEAPDFQLELRAWLLYRPPAGRLERPTMLFRDALRQELSTVAANQ